MTSYRDHETGGRATGRLVPQHVLYCRRHKWEFRITVDGPEAEARLAGTPLLSHPRYLKARQRVAEQLARYPGLPCHDSIVGTPDGRILVDGRPAPWGRSRLEFGDGLAPELLIA
ncbi:hypothetical protein [Sphaerisporangium siamense]|uniref:Uncharacterized protein n=1 Tax=Sphaerisporangium siamense TaxID=795645 RepID=A0A7W7GAP5_9ACTN|nr:hypothetical protein [Sphaerisporangium siamense]MBB4702592.1 hypothetical protein [Sphaerisporangium siamense]